MTLHLDLSVSQSNDINNDPWLSTWLWMPTNQMAWTLISDSAPGFECQPIKMTLTMISDSAPGFECQPIKWHEQWSVTLHLDLIVGQSNDINNDPWLCTWLNAIQSNNINNDPWLCTWIWMLANHITLTMISDSAPGFECQPIKWH
jgi:hypothetical protein